MQQSRYIWWVGILISIYTTCSAQTPSYNSDVACIIFSHCTSCHHSGGIAPLPLMTYDDVSAAAYGIQQAINARTMPPWPPNSNYNHLANERLLSDDEITTINDWINGGYPEGTEAPPINPVYTSSEEISNPDMVLEMPEDYTVNSVGEDVFRCFVIPVEFQQDIFITELEVVPGNREAVHHVMVYQDPTDLPLQLDTAEPGLGYTSFGSTNSEASIPIAGWNPGQGKKSFPEGMGVRIPAGSNIIMQIHYPATANGQADRSKLNINYTTQPLREINISSFIHHFDLNEGALTIPPNEIRTFTGNYTQPQQNDITLLDVNIHMHLLGKTARTWAVLPNEDTLHFLEIENWDFHWQGFYDFQRPIKIPGGTTFFGEATYDNTVDNPDNPHNPPQTVNMGNSSDDEMMLIFFSYVAYQPGDEEIVIDTSTVHPTHFCSHVGLTETTRKSIGIYPNPVDDMLRIQTHGESILQVELTDIFGRLVKRLTPSTQNEWSIGDLSSGVYHVSVATERGVFATKVMKR